MPATTTGAPFNLNIPSASSDPVDLYSLYLVPNMSLINATAAHIGTNNTFIGTQTFNNATVSSSLNVTGAITSYNTGTHYIGQFALDFNSTAPNGTSGGVGVVVGQIRARGTTYTSTGTDIAITPSGTGSHLAHLPDNLATGGNKRGTYSTDWQKVRSANTQVASGTSSVIDGGQYNAASGFASVVVGGDSNIASGAYASVLGGYQAKAEIYGKQAHASGQFAAAGDAQHGRYVLRVTTTNATATLLTADGTGTLSATNHVVLPANSVYGFTAHVSVNTGTVGTGSTTLGVFGGKQYYQGWARRGVAVSNISGTYAITHSQVEASISGIAVAILYNTTYGSMTIQVTGLAATVMHWVAVVETAENF